MHSHRRRVINRRTVIRGPIRSASERGVSVNAFHEKTGRSQVNSFFISRCCHLIGALWFCSLESRTWARRLTQSPELGFGLFVFSLPRTVLTWFCGFVLCGCRNCPSAAVVQRVVHLLAFGFVCLARVGTSRAKVSIGVANRKIFSELRVRTEMASGSRIIGSFLRPSALGITPIAPDASARAQNEDHHDQKVWRTSHPANRGQWQMGIQSSSHTRK
jgi:hypothetical protein